MTTMKIYALHEPTTAASGATAMAWTALATPFGEMRLHASARGLAWIALPSEGPAETERLMRAQFGAVYLHQDAAPPLDEACTQLTAYFAGERRAFTLALDLRGTPFQQLVWGAVAAILYGETRSYQQIARTIGRLAAVRAVGAANGANPLPIVIPCHRVIGADGNLTGYGGGLDMKRRLLAMERANTQAINE